MTLFENTKKIAKIHGMNLQQLAKKAGLSINAIYKWNQKDYHPSTPAVLAVANVLGVSIEELTGEKGKAEPTNIDLKAAMIDKDTVMSYGGRPIPEEELEMIRRILGGGK